MRGSSLQQYELRRDGALVATTRDASYIDTTLRAGRTYAYELVAINPLGGRAAPARVSVTTPGTSAGGGDGDPAVAAPAGLRAVVYSATAGAIAWNRAATAGLRCLRRDDRETIGAPPHESGTMPAAVTNGVAEPLPVERHR